MRHRPERVRGGGYGFASDVWSLGLIALEAAVGAYPYPGAKSMWLGDANPSLKPGPACLLKD